MIFVKLELQNQDTMKDSKFGHFWTNKQLLKIACLKGDIIYGSKRRTLVNISQTNWHKATQYCAKAALEESQPQKGIASIHKSNEIINLFLDLTPQARRKPPKKNSRDKEARHGIRRVALRVL